MLRRIHIRNIALITEQAIEFDDGFSVLTGETGAGKSIIIESFNFVLGERASRELIKYGAQKASAEAVFVILETEPAAAILREMELYPEDGELVLYRELSQTGKNVCRVNGTLVGTAMLKQIGDALIDIHGQHAHQSLLDPKKHLALLDQFAGAETLRLKQETAEAYHAYTEAKRALDGSVMNERERAQKCDLYSYQLQEIEKAELRDGEEEELLDERKKLQNAQQIMEALAAGTEGLSGETGALTALTETLRQLNGIRSYGEEYETLADKLQESYYAVEDAAYTLRDLRDGFSYDPQSLDSIEWRLELISQLKRKYGANIAEILAYAEKIGEEYQQLLTIEERRDQMQADYERAKERYLDVAGKLSKERHAAAARLKAALLPELSDLGMPGAAFEVQIERMNGEAPSATGYDAVEFLLSANRGEPIKALARVASGGELSRIMLAFKTVLAAVDGIPTMVFDEIDTGISGKIGTVVAEKMSEIAKRHQVLCVTHLAQIAAYADAHYLIEKQTEDEHTRSSTVRLDADGHCREVARIMGGEPDDGVALLHARRLIEEAEKKKSSVKTR